jgi:general secretion pathway protein B
MSYILDALRKAERDRHRARVPTLGTVHVSGVARRIPRWPWVVVALGLMIVASVIVALHGKDTRQASAPPPATEMRSTPAPSAIVDRPQTLPAPVAVARPDTVKRSGADVPAGSARPPAAMSPPATQPKPPDSVGEKKSAPRVGVVVPSAPVSQPPPSPGAPRVFQEMPAPLRASLSPLKLEVLYYADVATDRMVFINGRKYVEGQTVESKAVLVHIARDGAVLSYEGQRFLLPQ